MPVEILIRELEHISRSTAGFFFLKKQSFYLHVAEKGTVFPFEKHIQQNGS